MKAFLRSLLRRAGKGDSKVAAVFASTPDASHTAVEYLCRGAPGIPVWLFAQTPPLPATEALCDRVQVCSNSLALLFQAERALWPCWVALAVTTWTGERGRWPLKLAPFFIPPFRALILNNHGDFLPGTPRNVLRHAARRVRDTMHSGARRIFDIAAFLWSLVSYHIWRSGPVTRAKDKTAGYLLWLASLVLRLFSVLHRPFVHRAFYRLHGSDALFIAYVPSEGEGVISFCQNGPNWSAARLEQLLRSSSARWLLWREDERSPDAVDDMLPLFDDERTFAISRQNCYRAWHPMLFPTAPFRTLQPEEASQVLAPLSNCVLIDRAKLLALGIPRASLSGTAWMILFWKAAAAGWRSYSIGQTGAIGEQQSLPMQETGFLTRLLLHHDLRRLEPREPGLARGSIAFAPALRPAAYRNGNGRLKVLLVSPFLPYPLSHGGAVRIWNLCRALAGRVDFALCAIREKQDVTDYSRLREVFREVYIIDKDEIASTDESLPAQVRHHQSRSLRALMADITRTWKPDLLQIEYTHMAAFRDAVPHLPAILVEHDLTFSLYRQLAAKPDADASARFEYHRWLQFERRWLAAYDGVWTVSAEDREAAIAESGRAPERTFSIANGVDIDRFTPRDDPTPNPEIFYVGSFRHLPNIIGYEKLRDEVLPLVWKEIPQVRLRVVAGPDYEEYGNRFARRRPPADERIDIRGFIEDLRPLYARATVVVVPLEVSAGTNIKVLEAMACGKAVVSTPIGCAGLDLRDGEDALIADDWSAFARAVCSVIACDTLRSRIAAEARRTVESRFGWRAISQSAYQSYRALL